MNYGHKALLYAEKYGIIEYEVKGSAMTYEEDCGREGIYLCTVNLNAMTEVRKPKKIKLNGVRYL